MDVEDIHATSHSPADSDSDYSDDDEDHDDISVSVKKHMDVLIYSVSLFISTF